MADRPSKRRRLNPFIDVEAVGEADEHDEEREPSEGASLFDFLVPTHLAFMPDGSREGEDDLEDVDGIDVRSFSLRNAMENTQRGEEWDSFIARASSRGKYRDNPLSTDERLPRGEDRLWEIGCAVSGPFKVNTTGFDPLRR
jgi:hypothetical protein